MKRRTRASAEEVRKKHHGGGGPETPGYGRIPAAGSQRSETRAQLIRTALMAPSWPGLDVMTASPISVVMVAPLFMMLRWT